MPTREETMWAIHLGSDGPERGPYTTDRYLGYGYFKWDRPNHLSGYKVATWATRARAREALRDLKRRYFPWPSARAVKVTVTWEMPE